MSMSKPFVWEDVNDNNQLIMLKVYNIQLELAETFDILNETTDSDLELNLLRSFHKKYYKLIRIAEILKE